MQLMKRFLISWLVAAAAFGETKVRNSITLGASIMLTDKGAVGNGTADDGPAINRCLTAANAVQGECLCPPGTYRYTTAITSQQNTTLRGVGPKFGCVLQPDGVQAFKIRGADQSGGFAFRFYVRDLMIWPLNSPSSTKLVEINTGYSIHFDDVWVYTLLDNSSIAFDITDANEVELTGVVIYGANNATSKGVVTHTSAGKTKVAIIRPDFENLNHAIENNGDSVIDVLTPYAERNIVGVDNNGTAAGRVTMSGGVIHGVNSSTICARTLGTNTFIYGTLLDPGSGTNRHYVAAGAKVFYHDSSVNRLNIGAPLADGYLDPLYAITLNPAATRGTSLGLGIGPYVTNVGDVSDFPDDWDFAYTGVGGKIARFYGNAAATLGIYTDGTVQADGAYISTGSTFAGLGTPGSGRFIYCSDCTIANPCAGGGTGALAKRLNGVWVCN